jgi:hypothetical protein
MIIYKLGNTTTTQKSEKQSFFKFSAVIPAELLSETVDGELEDLGLVAEFKRIFNVSTDGRVIDVGKYTIKPTVDDNDDFDEDDYEELSF